MFRTIIFAIYAIISMLLLVLAWPFVKLSGKGYQVSQWVIDKFAAGFFWISGFSAKKSGMENIPGGPALFVAHHQGIFDMVMALAFVRPLVCFVAKKEAAKIWPLKIWMDFFPCIFIDRKNPRQSLACMQRAEELLRQGKSVFIFPEGTRSKDCKVARFKAGSFRPAIGAGVPVVPISISGSRKAFEEKGRITPACAEFAVLAPISTEGLAHGDTKQLAKQAEDAIKLHLGQAE